MKAVGRFKGGEAIFAIGKEFKFRAPRDLTLQAMINDWATALSDNTGSMSYEVRID